MAARRRTWVATASVAVLVGAGLALTTAAPAHALADPCPPERPVHYVVGTEGDDVLTGTDGADLILGLNGNDILNGDDGNDMVVGGDGDDTLNGGGGDDTLVGEGGNDTGNGGSGTNLCDTEVTKTILYGHQYAAFINGTTLYNVPVCGDGSTPPA